jgi:HEPN domain-containing protein
MASSDYWVKIAEYDLDTAEAMHETKRYLYVGFMCHQCIEKMLKGIYVARIKEVPPRTHNLARLLEIVGLDQSIPPDHLEIILTLNPLNIATRYPDYKLDLLNEIDHAYSAKLLSETRRLLKWIKAKL